MRTLWLHIGHDKTGSSALQGLLAQHSAVLGAAGILYPMHRYQAVLARYMGVGGGNGALLHSRTPVQGTGVQGIGARGVLFSAEGIFTALAQDFDTTLAWIRGRCAAWGLRRIAVLLFVRNPVAHAGSLYHQEVRHRGLTEAPDHYFMRYQRPNLVWQVLQRLHAAVDIALRVENYSYAKPHLAVVMADWLGLACGALDAGAGRRVNRGCTATELRVLRGLNDHMPSLTPWVARGVGLMRPHARAARVVAGYGAQQQLWQANADAMALVNRHYLGQDSAYRIVYRRPV